MTLEIAYNKKVDYDYIELHDLEISELNASVVLLSRFSDDLKSVRKLCNSKKMFISYNNYYKSS